MMRRPLLAVTAVLALLAGTATTAVAAPTSPDRAAARPGPAASYTPAGCNTAPADKQHVQCFATLFTGPDHQVTPADDGPAPTALGPADIRGAYHLPDTGQGQTVAVIDAYGDSHAESDLATFRAHYGLPPCTTANGCFTKVNQDGGTLYPPDVPQWGIETSLDLDAVSAACPNCNILLVEGINNSVGSLGKAAETAVALGAKYVSNSYGLPGEMSDEQTVDAHYDHPGVVVTAASGDDANVISWPASAPHVVAVGGTLLTRNGSNARGWNEAAWSGGGSGCSQYEPKPDFQQGLDTGCALRADADVSADADPASGLAVYDSLQMSGWLQVGGTSLSAPLIAAMYALAGAPTPGTYPVTYPYQRQGNGLFDITSGSNGSCGTVLCNAGPGWDGPTGLGTPDGVSALAPTGEQGSLTGTVTDRARHRPVSGVPISAVDPATGSTYRASTDAHGHYDLTIPAGRYDVSASMFGYAPASSDGVVVGADSPASVDFTIRSLPTRTLSGTVTDGSGHGWPMYAKIIVDGYPGAVFTNPSTGRYRVDLPKGAGYTLHVSSPGLPGYEATDVPVHLGDADATQNVALPVVQDSCTTPGYAYTYTGTTTTFEGWTGNTPQDGWTNADAKGNGEVWQFDNPGGKDPNTGGTGQFAVVDSYNYGNADAQDTSLVSPVTDLSGQTQPEIEFDSFIAGNFVDPLADVDVSIDGGQSWTNVWRFGTTTIAQLHHRIAIPQAAGQSAVRVRFHYAHTGPVERPYFWELDNIYIGNRACLPTPAGLVAGVVRDGNTGDALDGATVSGAGSAGHTMANPDDPAMPHGFYWLSVAQAGRHEFTAVDGKYTPARATVSVANDRVTHRDWTLRAGHLVVSPGSVSVSERMGQATTRKVRLTNDGTEPVHVTISEDASAFTPMATPSGAPLQQIPGHYSTGVLPATTPASGPALRHATPYAAPWTDLADYPLAVNDNTVARDPADGKIYSVGGAAGIAYADSFVYDPAAGRWDRIAPAPHPLHSAASAFVGGVLYVVGGWNEGLANVTTTYAYHPYTNTWTQVAYLPAPLASVSAAVLGGELYAIGGCLGNCAPTTSSVYRYDPGTDSWTTLADYPVPVAYAGCAGLAGEVVCAGGIDADTNQTYTSTYRYHPDTDTWTSGADMPYDNWAMVAGGANGRLQLAAGVTNGTSTITNRAAQYDPATDTWGALPNANNAEYRGGGACGIYQVGGATDATFATKFAQALPGYDQCQDSGNVPWLSENVTRLDLAPGKSAKVVVTVDSYSIAQPGDYAAQLSFDTDTPYDITPAPVAVHVAPPATWGKLAGTITDASTGAPIGGATVEICTMYSTVSGNCGPVTYTLKTDASGYYQLWLSQGYNPLQVIAADDLYTQQIRVMKITKGVTTTLNFGLQPG